MTISQAVYKWHTFVPVRFSRAVVGEPRSDAPDPDDRGFRDAEHGPVMGITAGETVRIKVRRTGIAESADLWVTATDASIVSISSPDHGHLASGASATLHVQGHRASGRTPNVRT